MTPVPDRLCDTGKVRERMPLCAVLETMYGSSQQKQPRPGAGVFREMRSAEGEPVEGGTSRGPRAGDWLLLVQPAPFLDLYLSVLQVDRTHFHLKTAEAQRAYVTCSKSPAGGSRAGTQTQMRLGASSSGVHTLASAPRCLQTEQARPWGHWADTWVNSKI